MFLVGLNLTTYMCIMGEKEWSEDNVFNIIVDKSKSCRKYNEWYKNI